MARMIYTPGGFAFKQFAPGDYESLSGTYQLLKLDAGKTQAWNVEYSADESVRYAEESGLGWDDRPMPVDGARTLHDALALFDEFLAAQADAERQKMLRRIQG